MGTGRSIESYTTEEVSVYVGDLDEEYSQYSESIKSKGINGKLLYYTDDNEITNILKEIGISSALDRSKLMVHLKEQRSMTLPSPTGTNQQSSFPPMSSSGIPPGIPQYEVFEMRDEITVAPSVLLSRLFQSQGIYLDRIDNFPVTSLETMIREKLREAASQDIINKEYDCFLNYRADTDEDVARDIYEKLEKNGIKTFWDTKCLKPGENWKMGFLRGLKASSCFVALISSKGLEPVRNTSKDHSCDNVLLEYEMALEINDKRKQAKKTEMIIPVLLSEKLQNGAISKFNGFPSSTVKYSDTIKPRVLHINWDNWEDMTSEDSEDDINFEGAIWEEKESEESTLYHREDRENEQNKINAIGIDLGTSSSRVAYYREDDTIVVVSNEYGNRSTPSYVAFDGDMFSVGDVARNYAPTNIMNTIFGGRRILGKKAEDSLVQSDIKKWPFRVVRNADDRPMIEVTYKEETVSLHIETIIAMILKKLKDIVEISLGYEVKNCVCSIPSSYNYLQGQSMKTAIEISGLNNLRLVTDSTLAGLAYGHRMTGEERNALIFDLGSGTLDVTLMTIEEDIFEVKAKSGKYLGGDDFDTKLVESFVDKFKTRYRKDITTNKRALHRLRTACERAKRTLSSKTQACIEIDNLFEDIDFSYVIERLDFEVLNMDLFCECLNSVDQVLRDSRMSKSQVHDIVLVGGSSRIPIVQELLSKHFDGKELIKSINPDEAVVRGAAIQAAILSGTENCDKLDDTVFLDATSYSYGISACGNNKQDKDDKDTILVSVIRRNTTLPVTKSCTITTNIDNLEKMSIRVFEGERILAKDNLCIRTLVLEGITPMPRGAKIKVTLGIDANFYLSVTASEESGKEIKIIDTSSEPLSQEMMTACRLLMSLNVPNLKP
jgi:heat shock 70kDa protein 1/2/6/8